MNENFANDVAAALGTGWTGATVGTYADRPTTIALGFGSARIIGTIEKDRVYWSPQWPNGGSGRYYKPTDAPVTISVGLDRSATVHAGELARRLLPAYLPLLAKALEQKSSDELDKRAAEMTAAKIAAILDGKVHEGSDAMTVGWYPEHEGYGEVVIYNYGSVKITLSGMPPALATQIMRVARDYGKALPKKEVDA